MDTIIIAFWGVAALLPLLVVIASVKSSRLDAILEVEEDNIKIRKHAFERLFRLKGETINSSDVVRIQFASNPIFGTCVSLFNSANGALDVWVPSELVMPIKSKLASACVNAVIVEV